MRTNNLLFKLALAAVALASVVVILGAFTRLVDAGLGCPDWPGCYGHLTWPDSADDVAKAEARFPESPVEHDKTWPEMVHRYFAGALGLLILALCIMTVKHARKDPVHHVPVKLSVALLVLVIVQAAFGMWTVTLKLWPQVVTAHLLGGFATLSLLWLYAQRVGDCHWRVAQPLWTSIVGLRRFAMAVMVVVILQILLGGWTSTNYAALACADFPTCHGKWWPQSDFAQGFNFFQHVGPNYLGGLLDNHARTAIHFTHRLGAVIVAVLGAILAIQLFRLKFAPAKRFGLILLGVLAAQISLGISNVVFALPLWVAVSHNAGGAILLLVLVSINHRLQTLRVLT